MSMGEKGRFRLDLYFLAIFTLACGFSNGTYIFLSIFFYIRRTITQYYTDVITLDILRGIQGIGAAATIPASVRYFFLHFIVQNLDTSFDFM